MTNSEENNDETSSFQKPIYLFGRDIRTIPCFRDSFIFGICFGFVGGLACFLGTSKITFSTHVAFGSLWLGVFGYWFPCRYKYETSYLMIESVKQNVKKKREAELELLKKKEEEISNSEKKDTTS